jgi:hypothetical protein
MLLISTVQASVVSGHHKGLPYSSTPSCSNAPHSAPLVHSSRGARTPSAVCITLKLGDPSTQTQRFGGALSPPGGTACMLVIAYTYAHASFTLLVLMRDVQMALCCAVAGAGAARHTATSTSSSHRTRRCSARCSTWGEGQASRRSGHRLLCCCAAGACAPGRGRASPSTPVQ